MTVAEARKKTAASKTAKTAAKSGSKRTSKTAKSAATRKPSAVASAGTKAGAKKKLSSAAKASSSATTKRKTRAASSAKAEPRTRETSGKPVTAPTDRLLTEEEIRAMPEDQYMNDAQLAFFRHRLLEMRQEVLDRAMEVKQRLHEREVYADPADRATAEEEHWLDLRLRERESLLLKKIDEALRRIEEREYGWCEVTGEPIGIPRLLARPTATVCVDVKDQSEHLEAQYRDR